MAPKEKPEDDLNPSSKHYKETVAGGSGEASREESNLSKLKDAEKSAEAEGSSTQDRNQSFYNPGSGASAGEAKLIGKVSNVAKKKAKFALIPAVLLGILIVVILLLINALKIPNYATEIGAYRMARAAHNYSKTTSRLDALKVRIASSDNALYNQISQKYSSLRDTTWGKFDKYRPTVMYENLKSSGTMSYKEETVKGAFGERQKITAIIVDGREYPIPKDGKIQGFIHPIQSYQGRVEFSAKLQANIDDALKGYHPLVRSKVAKKIRAEYGIKLRWWEKGGKTYLGTKAAEAQKILSDRKAQNVSRTATSSSTAQINQATTAAREELERCKQNPKCAQDLSNGKLPESVNTAIDSKLGGALKSVLSTLSTAYGIAVPICLVYDGSMVNAGEIIGNQEQSATTAYYSLRTSSDQIKEGDTTLEAVSAFDRQLNGAEDEDPLRATAAASVPDLYINGQDYDTSIQKSPHSSPMGLYGLANVVFGDGFAAELVNTTAENVCPVLTDERVAAGLIVGEAALAIFTGGTGTAAAKGVSVSATQAIKLGVRKAIKETAEKFVSRAAFRLAVKEGLVKGWGFTKRFGAWFVGIEATTAVAKMIVLHNIALVNDIETQVGGDYKDLADMGADIHNNDVVRQMFYGAPATNADVAISDARDQEYLAQKQQSSSVKDKYLALDNPRSMLYRFAYNANGFLNEPGNKIIENASFNNVASALTLGLSKKTKAADVSVTDRHYGIVQIDWTNDEENKIDSNESYEFLENSLVLQNNPEAVENIKTKYEKCFTENIADLLAEGHIQRDDDTGDVIKDKGDCSPQQLSYSNPEYGDLVFRYRLEQRYLQTLELNGGIQAPVADDALVLGAGKFRAATFNVLGNHHTEPGGKAPSWDSGAIRMQKTFDLIKAKGIQIVGFQEFEPAQRAKFIELTNDSWGIHPSSPIYGSGEGFKSSNSIVWDKSVFELVDSGYHNGLDYLGSSKLTPPWVILKHIESGEEIYFKNTHDPANVNGNKEQQDRLANARKHKEDALRRIGEGYPVLVVGDFNSDGKLRAGDAGLTRSELTYCVITSGGEIQNAYDTARGNSGTCPTNELFAIDHIYHSTDIGVDNWTKDTTPRQQKFSDHPMIYSDIIIGNRASIGSCSDPTSTAVYWPSTIKKNINSHDIPMDLNTPIHAIKKGTVIKSEDLVGCDSTPSNPRRCNEGLKSYGRYITIEHNIPGKGPVTYAHLSKRVVQEGDTVAAGQLIGYSGNSGNSSGPHLHLDFSYAEDLSVIEWLNGQKALDPPCKQTAWLSTDPNKKYAYMSELGLLINKEEQKRKTGVLA